ncbi:MAG: SDR family NAD(P)-dependent oxidoreductase [Acidimicrobiales bacterium]
MADLSGRVAVVTGAGRGIGAAIATDLARSGADVAVFDLDGSAAGEQASSLAATHGRRALGVRVDVTARADVETGLARVEDELGPVDILVNDAGIDVIQPFLESDEADWDRIIAVNLKGVLVCCHVVAPGMVARQRGKIVNIGSDAGRVGSSGEAVYSATKGGVIAFTKTLARELAATGVRVNCVSPGPTDTALLAQVAQVNQKLYDSLARAIPLRRIGRPEDVAQVVTFLAGPESDYMTGQTLSVSGGLTMA